MNEDDPQTQRRERERERWIVREISKKKNKIIKQSETFMMCFLNVFALDDDRLHDVLFVTLFGTVTVSEFE